MAGAELEARGEPARGAGTSGRGGAEREGGAGRTRGPESSGRGGAEGEGRAPPDRTEPRRTGPNRCGGPCGAVGVGPNSRGERGARCATATRGRRRSEGPALGGLQRASPGSSRGARADTWSGGASPGHLGLSLCAKPGALFPVHRGPCEPSAVGPWPARPAQPWRADRAPVTAVGRMPASSETRQVQFGNLGELGASLLAHSKESARTIEDPGSIPGWGRPAGEVKGSPLQYSCLENPMDREAWGSTGHGVAKSRTGLNDFH